MKKINNFLSVLKLPEYGYQSSKIEGIGFSMLSGARISISLMRNNCDNCLKNSALKIAGLVLFIFALPFTLLGAALKIVGSYFPVKTQTPLTHLDITPTAPIKITQIYDLLAVFSEICERNKVKYFMDGGTLLGAVRHHGIIPWDDDGDLGVFQSDKEAIEGMEAELNGCGIELNRENLFVQSMYKIRFNEVKLLEKYKINKNDSNVADVDITLYEQQPDGNIHCSSGFVRNQFPKYYYTAEELDDLQPYFFGHLILQGPKVADRYLKSSYGDECLEFAVKTHTHQQLCGFNVPVKILQQAKYKITSV